MPTLPALDQMDVDARRMAREGLGWEDLLARLKKRGATKSYCRMIVFDRANVLSVRAIRRHMAPDMSSEPT